VNAVSPAVNSPILPTAGSNSGARTQYGEILLESEKKNCLTKLENNGTNSVRALAQLHLQILFSRINPGYSTFLGNAILLNWF
jgi:hypothetical protein